MNASHTEARLLVATGRPIQPHSSDGLDGLPVHYRWVPVPREIFADVGFAHDASGIPGFCRQFNLDTPEDT